MGPIRLISEQFGNEVIWEKETATVNIKNKPATDAIDPKVDLTLFKTTGAIDTQPIHTTINFSNNKATYYYDNQNTPITLTGTNTTLPGKNQSQNTYQTFTSKDRQESFTILITTKDYLNVFGID